MNAPDNTPMAVEKILLLRDPRDLEAMLKWLDVAWADLHNPFSLRYDELIGSGMAASVSTCLSTAVLDVSIDDPGSCGSKARVRIAARSTAAPTPDRLRCLDDVVTTVFLQHVASAFAFDVEANALASTPL
ncbi:hypothetical protein [Cupriavidus sp. RAF12]|uniref:hypothetical protein n=1 Tax=Cupriavidus sp. RAF12 TaxID=3233050 RepID=UPI003F8FF707